ncbi:UNVERIFIED_CONTAM: hypothetical protein Slati_0283500 [Sesamum latifolium]|uniref:Uncharacterized protein n=1 Tax=Sesamum latifolium TaxID=2727402 RepID=A0AAW2YDW8_9LAMI
MSGADEEWVKAALTDDTMVVELLVSLHAAAPTPLKQAALPLEWSVRQRRSKPVSVGNPKKQQSQRASPTTPLSWSGATSLSGGSAGSGGAAAGGSEESSRPPIQKLSAATRSKVCAQPRVSCHSVVCVEMTLIPLWNLDICCHACGRSQIQPFQAFVCFLLLVTCHRFFSFLQTDNNALPLPRASPSNPGAVQSIPRSASGAGSLTELPFRFPLNYPFNPFCFSFLKG